MGTNANIRYTNYIVPHVDELKDMGAVEINLLRYGKFFYVSSLSQKDYKRLDVEYLIKHFEIKIFDCFIVLRKR
jgi:hypothetical protein